MNILGKIGFLVPVIGLAGSAMADNVSPPVSECVKDSIHAVLGEGAIIKIDANFNSVVASAGTEKFQRELVIARNTNNALEEVFITSASHSGVIGVDSQTGLFRLESEFFAAAVIDPAKGEVDFLAETYNPPMKTQNEYIGYKFVADAMQIGEKFWDNLSPCV